jgi:O-antigen ligase
VTVVAVIGGVLVVLLIGGKSITADRLNVIFSGRDHLVSGGAELFGERPLWGYGSGSFQKAYSDHHAGEAVTISHTEPVTVGAEQGLIGLVAYIALVVVSLATMGAGLWARGPDRDPPYVFIARAAVIAAFVALLVHTMAYAGFFQDPITWVLMAIGASLAAARVGAPDRSAAADAAPEPA